MLAWRARKLASRSKAGQVDELGARLLADVPTTEPDSGLDHWLDLAQSEVLVVPRLGALAQSLRFSEEVRNTLPRDAVAPRIVNDVHR